MIVKLIRCRVIAERRRMFHQAQARWSALASVRGFAGQLGGWDAADENEAVVLGLWQDRPAYDRFMSDVHDTIYASARQAASIASSRVTLWTAVIPIPGTESDVAAAMQSTGLIRVALCTVRTDRVDHFASVQRTIWNPGMGSSGGMLLGWLCRSVVNPLRYAVCTFWRSQEAHGQYRSAVFPALCNQAQPAEDCESIDGCAVATISEWKVTPA